MARSKDRCSRRDGAIQLKAAPARRLQDPKRPRSTFPCTEPSPGTFPSGAEPPPVHVPVPTCHVSVRPVAARLHNQSPLFIFRSCSPVHDAVIAAGGGRDLEGAHS